MRNGESGTFSQARGLLQKSNRFLVLLLVSAFVLAAGAWFVFVSGYFSVNRIEMNDLHTVSREEVISNTYDILEQGRWRLWDKKNIFLVDAKDLAGQLKDRLFAERVTVNKFYPNILRLMIEERQRSVILVSKGQLLVIDMEGMVAGEAGENATKEAQAVLSGSLIADLKRTPIIMCDLPELAAAGYQVTDQSTLKSWIGAYRTFIASGLKFRYIKIQSLKAKTAKLVMQDGWDAYFDLGKDLQSQIETYEKFIKSKPPGFKVDEYIDVRVPGKIYVK